MSCRSDRVESRPAPRSFLAPLLLLLVAGTFWWGSVAHLDAAVRINEFLAANSGSWRDEDGDASDWIELYNASQAPVDLAGWSLTDNLEHTNAWSFPELSIPAGAYLIVFASGKNRAEAGRELHTGFQLGREGEYLALIEADGQTVHDAFDPAYPPQRADVSYGRGSLARSVVPIPEFAPCTARVPIDDSIPAAWFQSIDFDDTDWQHELTGVGYDRNSDYLSLINLDVGAEMDLLNTSVYIRVPFTVEDAALMHQLTFRMKYDDGFVAWINGHEIARANAPTSLAWDAAATGNHYDNLAIEFEPYPIANPADLLRDGTNLLAIHGLNRNRDNSDLVMVPELTGEALLSSVTEDPVFFTTPTPGAPNAGGVAGLVADTKFSVNRGFFTNAFSLVINSATTEAFIYYTRDGSAPSPTHHEGSGQGSVHLTVDRTTVVRAMAHVGNWLPSNIDTHTYLFLNTVPTQPAAPEGFPSVWDDIPADYEMDPDITGQPAYGPRMKEALTSIPSVSIVTATENLFDADAGIYANPEEHGEAWERPASVEWIRPDGATRFQEDCGLRIQGGYFRRRTASQKHSFRLLFRERYGVTRLRQNLFEEADATREFDTLTFRAGANDGYAWDAARYTEQYTRDEFGRRLFLDMGALSSRGTFVHLYVNGLYWGLYNPSERPDDSFSANYAGGEKEEWDSLNSGDVQSGNDQSWNALLTASQAGLDTWDAYQALQGLDPDGSRNPAYDVLLEMDQYIRYMLVNIWGGNWDWPNKNWWGARRRGAESQGWLFYAWDYENTMGNNRARSPVSMVSPRSSVANQGAGIPHQALLQNPEYRLRFADEAHRHLFHDGLLTPASLQERYHQLADPLEAAMIAESARWGDMHHSTPLTLADWQSERDWMLSTYLDQRSAVVLGQLRSLELYPDVEAPQFQVNGTLQYGGLVTEDSILALTAAAEMYYTIDGSDPRESPSGQPIGNPYTGPLPLEGNLLVKARAYAGGTWSALSEAAFLVARTPQPGDLAITEIHYRPAPATAEEAALGYSDRADFEFVELMNTTDDALDLTGLALTGGVMLDFDLLPSPLERLLPPQTRALLVGQPEAFRLRYGSSPPILGTIQSGRLSDDGESLSLIRKSDDVLVLQMTFNDASPWPSSADGQGYSLVLRHPKDDPNNPVNWRASQRVGGTPGRHDSQLLTDWMREEGVSDPYADANGDGQIAFQDYAMGTDPLYLWRVQVEELEVNSLTNRYATLRIPRRLAADDAKLDLQTTERLTASWTNTPVLHARERPTEDLEVLIFRYPSPVSVSQAGFFQVTFRGSGLSLSALLSEDEPSRAQDARYRAHAGWTVAALCERRKLELWLLASTVAGKTTRDLSRFSVGARSDGRSTVRGRSGLKSARRVSRARLMESSPTP